MPLRWVLIRDRQARFGPQALLCTDGQVNAQQIVEWFGWRWQRDGTFHEARAHRGIETQRQWSDRAIQRTTPALFGLFSVVPLVAHPLLQHQELPVRQAAWYTQPLPTFADTLALVRRELWRDEGFSTSPTTPEMVVIPRPLWERLTNTLAYTG